MFEISNQDEVLVITLESTHLEAANAAEFKQALSSMRLPESGKVLVDCVKLEFIDSSGLGALLHLNNSLKPEVRPLALRNLQPEVLSVLELLRLNSVFALEP
ncbi:STAS domain-containing protein [Cerasicoccus maritimus]|uniref:STAS domain-containing protein n=1 Tax=Cerasicoccus maritimus TaxID=490089 RepID=UPI0028529098|nr:STAS domain-containing protein [Cerasicoccus maritimus]